jgi:hypothetical protein
MFQKDAIQDRDLQQYYRDAARQESDVAGRI